MDEIIGVWIMNAIPPPISGQLCILYSSYEDVLAMNEFCDFHQFIPEIPVYVSTQFVHLLIWHQFVQPLHVSPNCIPTNRTFIGGMVMMGSSA